MIIGILAVLPMLGFAAYQDMKYRVIPDKVHVLLLIMAAVEIVFGQDLFYISASERITGIFVPAVILFFIYMINPNLSGGGDFKLFSCLGFAVGIYAFIAILFVANISGLLCSIWRREKYIPMATHIFIGAVFVLIIFWR